MRENIKKIISRLVKKFKTRNPFELCKCLGIWVYEIPLGNTKGYYTYSQRKKVIFINEALNNYEKILVCAHELGHAMLHPRANIYFMRNHTHYVQEKFEITAQMFAAELLITLEMIEECPSYYCVNQIAASINMPVELLKLKLM